MKVTHMPSSNHREQHALLSAPDRTFRWLSCRKRRRFTRITVGLLVFYLGALASPLYAQDYENSVVATDFDFIHDTDPSTFMCLEYKGQGLREMPDSTRDSPLVQSAFIFVAYFGDGTSIDMALNTEFEKEDAARTEALRYVPRLDKLPTSLRQGVERLVIHKGSEDSTAFSDVGLIVLYSGNATKRISEHDLEETIFHESVHAAWGERWTWDEADENWSKWREAQASDGAFVTNYASENADEDLAESALFAYTLIHHPERIPEEDAARISSTIPARIAFIRDLLPPDEPIFYDVGPEYSCDGSGETFTVTGN